MTGPATGPATGVAADGMLRARLLGTTGALLVALGALGAGALPVPHPLAGLRLVGLPARTATLSLALAWAGAALLVLAWLQVSRRVRAGGPLAPSRAELGRTALLWALPLAIAPPVFSRDVYSYLAQGAVLARGLDPYALGPAEALGMDDPLVRSIPAMWRDTPSPYGPLFLGLARGVAVLAGDDVALGVLVHRVLALAGLALVVAALPALARRCGVDPRYALWCGAAHPLVLFHLVGGVHNDALMLGLLLAGLELGLRAGERLLDGRLLAGAVLVVAASAVKLPALVALGVLGAVRARGGGWRAVAAQTGVLGAVAVAGLAVCTAATGAGPGWLAALGVPGSIDSPFSPTTDLGYAAGVLGVLAGLGDHTATAVALVRAIGLVAGAGVVGAALLAVRGGRLDPVAGLGASLAAVVLLGPAGQPWYLLWALVPLVATPALPRLRRALLAVSVPLALVLAPTGGLFPFHGFQPALAVIAALLLVACSVWGTDRWYRPSERGIRAAGRGTRPAWTTTRRSRSAPTSPTP
ncbi:polyprenol phosphomannose-dependent alpha 1,6 mannosyltransferase MptB [Pseudonocardia broussonetiae]|uniref:Polyprenol phosphomannose-dependent alpha 1,6 mannosyltransferase MptB n=1 Tax=Pseudonocardia broussonetiae TaxID=2736640 RepID=A0A6M6JPG4_9PSEU|nr:polyprenol phosphomannose-dependent alpha 1,6 mannosyltransferase MptB [Pseudonocardia broussonetiae]QJY48837.1 polyprenol phosphomannose-dependent alpha 1,6 mannosyltransferase MptB [Pseudonocardia broussonetiae]